jgi:hypothetical protein
MCGCVINSFLLHLEEKGNFNPERDLPWICCLLFFYHLVQIISKTDRLKQACSWICLEMGLFTADKEFCLRFGGAQVAAQRRVKALGRAVVAAGE